MGPGIGRGCSQTPNTESEASWGLKRVGPAPRGASRPRDTQWGTDVTRASWFWEPSAKRCANRSQILLSPWVSSFYCPLCLAGPPSACLTPPQPLRLCLLHALTCCPHHHLLELPWLVLCRVLGALGQGQDPRGALSLELRMQERRRP